MEEIWKDIKGYEGLYQASNLGRVRSFRNSSRKKCEPYILSPGKINSGYLNVVLNKNGVRQTLKLHRLIAETFIPNPNNLSDVNHKDENKLNNCVDNLEWMSHKDNMNYGTLKSRLKNKHINSELSKKVIQKDLNGNVIKIWDSISQAAKHLNICCGNITNCCKHRSKSVGGFAWEYA